MTEVAVDWQRKHDNLEFEYQELTRMLDYWKKEVKETEVRALNFRTRTEKKNKLENLATAIQSAILRSKLRHFNHLVVSCYLKVH